MVAAAAAIVVGALAAPAAPCAQPLPQGPPLPAPIVIRTSCGGFRLAVDGRVTRLPRGWFAARAGGTGRRYGADLQIRRNRPGRIVIARRDRVVWRSSALYPNDGGNVAFGRNRFAFAAYHRGVFLTDLERPERLIVRGRGLAPYAFFRSGRLIVIGGGALTVVSPEGQIEHRYRYRAGSAGVTYDADTETVYFVTRTGRLATLRDAGLAIGRRIAVDGQLVFSRPGLLLVHGARSLAVTSLDGRLLARTRWPQRPLGIFDSGASVSPNGRYVAYRLSDARAGDVRGNAALYILRVGEMRGRSVYGHRLGPIGCGSFGSMGWHGRHLLYSAVEGQAVVVDAATGRQRDLSRVVAALPRRSTAEQPLVTWASSYR